MVHNCTVWWRPWFPLSGGNDNTRFYPCSQQTMGTSWFTHPSWLSTLPMYSCGFYRLSIYTYGFIDFPCMRVDTIDFPCMLGYPIKPWELYGYTPISADLLNFTCIFMGFLDFPCILIDFIDFPCLIGFPRKRRELYGLSILLHFPCMLGYPIKPWKLHGYILI